MFTDYKLVQESNWQQNQKGPQEGGVNYYKTPSDDGFEALSRLALRMWTKIPTRPVKPSSPPVPRTSSPRFT